MKILKNKNMNFFSRLFHTIRRKFTKIKLSSKFDKNKSAFETSKLSVNERNAVSIFKKVLKSEDALVHYSRRSETDLVVDDVETKILLKDISGNKIEMYIETKGLVYMVQISEKTYYYFRWLIKRRSDIKYTHSISSINEIYSNQLSTTLENIK